ncbi:LysR family transcriptional regulator [Aliidongia dinghuensis]|uniref:LysR family transcriptional regulator n=1 Tax=Aliidongia dinghuensis TaxID=1867774 RepID=A0A8J3E1Z8_9PROT|nr:LysR family transcriptional regulator [Aliidongia dinghuensis]
MQELRYLIAVADYGHFGRAAEACHVTQPTLSTQLKRLEDFLGATLFERTNKTVHVTPIGEEVVARARKVVAEADALVDSAQENKEPLSGPLHIGIIPTLSPYLLSWLLPALKLAYPHLQMVVHEDLTDHLLERLTDHKLDAALLALPVDTADLEAMPLFNEPFFFAAPKGHPLTKTKTVKVSELKNEHLLLLTDGHCLRDQALAVCGFSEAARNEEMDFRATSLETIRSMVAAGMGCTLMPALAVAGGASRDIEVRPLAGRRSSRQIGLVRRRTYPKLRELQLFGQAIRDSLPPSVVAA